MKKKDNVGKNEDTDLYHGYLGDYRFISYDVVKNKDKDIMILDIEYRNTTDRSSSPVLSFLLDTEIIQNNNGKTVKLDKADSLTKELNSSVLKPSGRKLMPGEKADIIIPIVLNSDNGTVIIKNLMNEGNTFSKLINL